MEKNKYGTISLPTPLIDSIKKKIEGTGMNSVSAYVSFVLRQILSSNSEELMDKQTETSVKERLKRLGYD
jgi:hypothetical protein